MMTGGRLQDKGKKTFLAGIFMKVDIREQNISTK
jgi:hypothetical protein